MLESPKGGPHPTRFPTHLVIVDADVSGVAEVQRDLPAQPAAVHCHVPICRHTVQVLVGPQGPNQLACGGSPDHTQVSGQCGEPLPHDTVVPGATHLPL